ncbi:MAG: hypothetical protein CVU84_15575 [Firmicutes bacterium HGW-Firmicutes-1]|jgi:uncharacterized membrane protein|nr:MAG: hypothetical protein CVU84_15575 [Firmicutes bacterium HGW-Firmicutes-1]
MANKLDPIGQSSLGMGENVAALLAIIFSPISSIVILVLEKDSKFVKFHAIQAIALSVVIIVLNIVLGFIPILGWIVLFFVNLGAFVLWIIVLIKAYQGEWFEIPLVGKFSMEQVNKQ